MVAMPVGGDSVRLRRVPKMLAAARQVELLARVGAPQSLHKLPTKDPAQDLHRQEEARVFGMNPALVIGRQPTSGDDAVDVRMADQGLPPRVEDAEYANLRTATSRSVAALTWKSQL